MKRTTRRIAFILAVVLFALASAVALEYAQGYTLDLQTWKFVRSGAIALNVNAPAKMFVDDVLVGSTSFLRDAAGKDRLVPGVHEVHVYREGWSSWSKSAQVEAGRLTDFPSVLILPIDEGVQTDVTREITDAFQRALLASSSAFTLSFTDNQYATFSSGSFFDARVASGSLIASHVLGVAQQGDDRVLWWTANEVWVMWRRATNYQPLRIQGERALVARFRTTIQHAGWYDADHIVVDAGPSGVMILETDMRGGQNIIRI